MKIEIKTYENILIRSFKNYYELLDYCKTEFCMLVGHDYNGLMNDAETIANKIWNANVGEYLKTDLGHLVYVIEKKQVSQKFIDYIKKCNDKARKFNQDNKGTGNFQSLMIENPKHWEEYGVYNLRDFVRFSLETYVWDEYKSVHGIRPRFMNFNNMGIRELRKEVNLLNK